MFYADPVIEALFEGREMMTETPMQFADAQFRNGDWPNATIQEVTERPLTEFGRSIQIKVNLDGDSKPFNFRGYADAAGSTRR